MLCSLPGHSSVICGGIALCPYLLLLSPASFLVFLLALTALALTLLLQLTHFLYSQSVLVWGKYLHNLAAEK
jgi:hypothetical protein